MVNNRLYNWNEDSIRWYLDAEPYDSFHSLVAKRVLSALPSSPSVLDVGSGVGALTFPLAEKCTRVVACDIQRRPLEVVEARAAERNLGNVSTVCGDFLSLPVPETKFDAVVFCRFGKMRDFAERALKWSRGKVFFVQNASRKHSFAAQTRYGKTAAGIDCRRFLDSLGVSYTVRGIVSEMGQPFRSRPEAERFLAFYDGESGEQARSAYLDRNLVPNDDPDFPLFLPSEKHYQIFEIDAF